MLTYDIPYSHIGIEDMAMQEIIWGKGDTEDMGNTHYVLSSTLSLHGSRGPGTVHSIKNNTGKD